MKFKSKKIWFLGLGILGLSAIVAPTFSLTSCGKTTNQSKVLKTDAINKSLENNKDSNQFVFDTNSHNNVSISKFAAYINAAQIKHFEDFAKDQNVTPFFNFLKTKSVLVINAQVPSTKWPRISDDAIAPATNEDFINTIQKKFIVMTPQVYSLVYTSPTNSENPGFGMKFPVPTDLDKKQDLLGKYWHGEILGSGKSDTTDKSKALFDALKGSVDLVIYMYPASAQWITDDIKSGSVKLSEALKPLLTKSSSKKPSKAIIAEPIDLIYNPLFSDLGNDYLQQMFINGLGYTQTHDGDWTKNPSGNWNNNLLDFYEAFSSDDDKNNVSNFRDKANAYTPYFDISASDFVGVNLVASGYTTEDQKTKVTWPFAGKFIKSLKGRSVSGDENTNTFSIYYNATDSLISLGFAPTFTSYIYNPNQVTSYPDGLVLNSYVSDWYPNLVSKTGEMTPEEDKIIPIPTEFSGIAHHKVSPNIKNLQSLKINTMFAPDFVMEKTAEIYSNGNPVVDRIVYVSHGDFSIDGQSFFNKDNSTAAFNTIDGKVKYSYTGYYPQNLLDVQLNNGDNGKISFFDKYLTSSDFSTTSDPNDKPNSIMATYRSLQWFANQISSIKIKDFQIPKSAKDYLPETDLTETEKTKFGEKFKGIYDWNIGENVANNTQSNAEFEGKEATFEYNAKLVSNKPQNEVLPSEYNAQNSQNVEKSLTAPEGMTIKIVSAENNDAEGILTIKYTLSKGEQSSKQLTLPVNGFKKASSEGTASESNAEFEGKEATFKYNAELVSNKPKNEVLPSEYNVPGTENVKNSLTAPEGMTIKIVSAENNDAEGILTIKYTLSKGEQSSKQLTLPVNGFKKASN